MVFNPSPVHMPPNQPNTAATAGINKGILKKVRSIQKSDDEDYFERFLRLVTERKLTKAIKLEVVSKISPLLHDIKTKEEKVLALQVLNTIEIPSDKKTLLEALLRDLETSEFDGEEKSLFARVIEQTSI